MVPTIVGFSKIVKINSNQSQKDDIYVGLDALKRSPLLSIKYPIEHGIILDWDEITLFLEHLFKLQNITPSQL
jgi:actin-related protein